MKVKNEKKWWEFWRWSESPIKTIKICENVECVSIIDVIETYHDPIENFIRDTYMKYEVDDFEVYIDPRLNFEGDEIIIDLENFFFLKRLTQKGLSI